jgi:hypothetical protein
VQTGAAERGSHVIEALGHLLDHIGQRQSKLILLVGGQRTGKSGLLQALGTARQTTPLNVGMSLGAQVARAQVRHRQLQAPQMLRELADRHAHGDILLIDNIELLFDRSLRLDPLDLLKRHAHARRVVASWPGELRDGRLIYADRAHPEHQDYGLDGVVTFPVQP